MSYSYRILSRAPHNLADGDSDGDGDEADLIFLLVAALVSNPALLGHQSIMIASGGMAMGPAYMNEHA